MINVFIIPQQLNYTAAEVGDFLCLIAFILLEQNLNLNLMKKCIKINISVELQYQKKRKKNIRT